MTGRSTDSLVESLYIDLQEMAAAKMRGEQGWSSQSHFLRATADAMRRILVDQACKRLSIKRGGDKNRQDLPEFPIALSMPADDLLASHDCLDKFAEEDPVKAELVKLRVFAGLNHLEAAEALDLPKSTADRYWAFAKARLMALMSAD